MEDLLTGDLRPVRRAPPPPSAQPRNDELLVIQGGVDPTLVSSNKQRGAQNGHTHPGHHSITRSSSLPRSTSLPLTNGTGRKKPPPPRPPPPKTRSSQKKQQQQQQQHHHQHDGYSWSRGQPFQPAVQQRGGGGTSGSGASEASLIDLSSPPASPATRSGSDGLSVNSFGSESSGNHSCGLDDFLDPFASLQDLAPPPKRVGASAFFSGTSIAPQNAAQSSSSALTTNDDNQDPFDLLARRATATPPTNATQPSFLPGTTHSMPPATINGTGNNISNSSITHKVEQRGSVKATIIRPKAPVTSSQVGVAGDSGLAGQMSDLVSIDWSAAARGNNNSSSVPKQQQQGAWDTIIAQTIPEEPPPLPPRPDSEEETDRPYGIAEFDFSSSQKEDLDFKVGDVIQLLYRVNEDWLCGRCGLKEGIFPLNFIKIVVPLAGERAPGVSSSLSTPSGLNGTNSPTPPPSSSILTVTALYSFQAETPEDLTIHEGSTIRVIGKLNDQWLMGECDGRTGQFPASFVNNVPPNLPQV
ncbi:hypothetical protein Pmani_005616 [Petrolisthes manimaculis]|uniref:SH3 domain-containing protein n=1 Tax=Petrolisthes manimaculis TaxID=1843537 RepID=A0AAE1QEK1_9EUCA|nr:hypothetical protein Pmani_005616 [Petrolisthes manimaculis]